MPRPKTLALRDKERVELAVRAVMFRRQGLDWDDIAHRLEISVIETKEIAKVGYARLSEQTADELRTEVEDRLNGLLRRAEVDLSLADSQTSRTGLYRTILAIEAQRARLLGLNLSPLEVSGDAREAE